MSLLQHLKEAKTILFLCSGNIIRSSFAELYSKHIGVAKFTQSAGTTYRNSSIYPKTRQALQALNCDSKLISAFNPTHVDDLVYTEGNYLIFGMKKEHLVNLPIKLMNASKYLLSSIDDKNYEIADPYFDGGFTSVYNQIRILMDKLKIIVK